MQPPPRPPPNDREPWGRGALDTGLLRALIHASNSPVVWLDPSGLVVEASVALSDLLGIAPEALPGLHWQTDLHLDGIGGPGAVVPRDLPPLREPRQAWLRLRNGSAAVEVTAYPAEGGGTVLVLRLNRSGLRRPSAELTALLEQIPAGVFIGDREGIQVCNHRGLDLLGLASLDELQAGERQLVSRLHLRHADTGEPVAADEDVFTRGLRGEVSERDLIARHLHTGRERILHALGAPVRDGDRIVGAIAICTDITERRRLEAELRQVQKSEALSRLAGGIAHDFNNIIMGIHGYVHLLLQELMPQDPRRADVEAIAQLSQRATVLTAQLMAFARRQATRPQWFQLDDVVAAVERQVRPVLHGNVRLEVKLGAPTIQIRTDQGQFEQVVTALLLRGRDALLDGGRLEVSTGLAEVAALPATALPGAAFRPGPYAVLSVHDSGTALTRQQRQQLFEPFAAGTPASTAASTATGLGLALVLGTVQQAGGFVRVDSEPSEGTTIAVYFPVPLQRPAEEEPSQRAASGSGSETVLIAEDEQAVREVLARSLRMRGFQVVEAENGAEAMALVERGEVRIDIVVTDLVMPVMGGRDLALALEQLAPALPVVFMSGYADDDAVLRELSDGQRPFLQKPFRPEALARVVRTTLDVWRRAHEDR